MKKIYNILALVGIIFVLAACGSQVQAEQASHFPFEENLVLFYEIDGPAFSDTFTIFNSYIHENRMQRIIKMDNLDSIMLEIMQATDGEVRHIVGLATSQNEWLAGMDEEWVAPFVDFTESRSNTFRVIMPIEPVLGDIWETDPFANATEMRTSEITGVDITITVPAGTFNTIEIVTTRPDAAGEFLVPPRVIAFYAPGIGLVEQRDYPGIRTTAPDGLATEQVPTITRLMSYSRDGLVQSVLLFLPDEIGTLPQLDVNFTTNNDLLEVFNIMLRDAAEMLFGYSLPADARLNRAFINPNSRNLHLDFSAAFLQSIRGQVADAEAEGRVISAIVDTFALLYHAAGVTITVDEAPYNGPFISFSTMEFWPFGTSLANVVIPEDPIFEEFRQVAAAIHPQFLEVVELDFADENNQTILETVFTEFFIEEVRYGFRDVWNWTTQDAEIIPFSVDSFQLTDALNTMVFFVEEEAGWRIDYMIVDHGW